MNILIPFSPILRKLAKVYTSKERKYSFKGINIKVEPGVFHPGLFISTKILLNFTDKLKLKDRSFLELGAGSGIISVLAAKKGAKVHASDISSVAVENIKSNAKINNAKINVIKSNLFESIPKQRFDFIIINPPYYQKNPETEEDYAWFCGSDYEFFTNLFSSISHYINSSSRVFIILSEVCNVKKIKSIGESKGFKWKIELEKSVWGEKNFIYSLRLQASG